MTKHYFARTNAYGSDTSVGFANTFSALVFRSKTARDEYVAKNADANLAVKSITAKDARKLANRNGPDLFVLTIGGDWVRI